jgi:cell shape-determining protein MreC
LVVATLVVVLLFIVDTLSGGGVRIVARSITSTLSQGLSHIATSIFGSGYLSSRSALESENRSLTAQVAQLQERAALATALQAQVQVLASMAHLAESVPGITAPVTSSVIASPYGTFLIGVGTAQGVRTGALALSSEGLVIGRVSQVDAHTSTVVETFAPGATTQALLVGAALTVRGVGGGNAITQAPHGLVVHVGDAVTAPEFAGRPIGIVGHVDSNPSSATVQVYIGLPITLSALQYVYIVTPQ